MDFLGAKVTCQMLWKKGIDKNKLVATIWVVRSIPGKVSDGASFFGMFSVLRLCSLHESMI